VICGTGDYIDLLVYAADDGLSYTTISWFIASAART